MPRFVYLDQNRLIDTNDRMVKWLRFLEFVYLKYCKRLLEGENIV